MCVLATKYNNNNTNNNNKNVAVAIITNFIIIHIYLIIKF